YAAEQRDSARYSKRSEPDWKQRHRHRQPIHSGNERHPAQSDIDLRSDKKPEIASVHQRKLLCCADASRSEWPYAVARDIRTCVLQFGSWAVQKLPDQGIDEAPVPDTGVQLPESPAVVVTGASSIP